MIFPGLFGMSRRENETVNLVFVILEAESDGGSSVLEERLTRTVCWPMAAQRCPENRSALYDSGHLL